MKTSSLPLKVLVLLCALLFNFSGLRAQLISSYTFSQNNTNPYLPLTNPVLVDSGSGLDNQVFPLTLPFGFNFDNTVYTDIYLGINGYISFGTANPGNGYWMLQSPLSGFRVVSGLDANLASLATDTSELSYEVVGIAPNRKFIAQWKDFGFPGTNVLRVNFQIQLSESSNEIRITYGTCSLTGSSSISAQVGLRGLNNATFFNRSSPSGSWTNTTQGTLVSANIFYQSFNNPPSGLRYTFTPPPPCAVPPQPTNLVLVPGFTNINISYTPTPATDKYIIVRTPGITPLNDTPVNGTTYPLNSTLGNGTVIYNGTGTSYSNTGLTMNTNYTYTVFPYNDVGCLGSPKYNATAPLTGTLQTGGPKAYTWVPTSGTADAAIASNWSPARVLQHENDTLLFSNGGTVTATNMSSQTINRLIVRNNTQVTLNSNFTEAISIDDSFKVESGSSLTLDGAGPLSLKYLNNFGVGVIDGTLNVNGTCTYDASFSGTTVSGTLRSANTGNILNTCSCAPANFVFLPGSSYDHMRNGGNIPNAYYFPTSTINVTGITNTAPTIAAGTMTGNLVWNCTTQAATINIGNISSIKGNFNVVSTSSHTLQHGSGATDLTVNGNFIQEAGTVQMTSSKRLIVHGNSSLQSGILDMSSVMNNSGGLVFNGNLIQGASHLLTKTGNSNSMVVFSGTANQVVTLGGNLTAAGTINVTLNNPAGAVLTGTFPINSNATHTVTAGSWTGTGSFQYGTTNSTLVYNNYTQHAVTAAEWPAVSGPQNVTVNMAAAFPANQLIMPGHRTIEDKLNMNNGIVVLGDYDLVLNGSFPFTNTPGTPDNFIAANGNGKLIRRIFNGNNQAILFPLGDTSGTPEASPATITLTNTSGFRYISARVTNSIHPNETATAGSLSRYWSITDTASGSFTYSAAFTYNAADVNGSPALSLNAWNGSTWSGIASSNTGTRLMTTGTLNSATSILNGRDFTGRVNPSVNYTWTGAVSTDYMIADNWTPSRIVHDPSDLLTFNNGQNNQVTNLNTESVTRVMISNNTTVNLKAAAAATLTLVSDNNPVTDELSVAAGSSLILNGNTAPAAIAFAGTGGTANISGLAEISNTLAAAVNVLNFTNAVATVAASGELASGGTLTNNGITSNASSLVVKGTFQYKFTTAGAGIPVATWDTGSNVLITGVTTAGFGPVMDNNPSYYNVTYNCPNQTSEVDMSSRMPSLVKGTFHMLSTGSGKIQFTKSLNSGYNLTVGKFIQSGGYIDLNASGTNLSLFTLSVADTFRQTGGTFLSSSGANGIPKLKFTGAGNGRQYVRFNGTAPTGKISYTVTNPSGILLEGSGGLSVFGLSNGATLQISTPVAYPVLSTLTLQYAATAGIVYDAAGSYSVDSVVWPALSVPGQVTVNIQQGNILTIPFSRTIGKTLVMTSGDIDLGSYDLVLGTDAANPGTLNHNDDTRIRVTSGSLTRWYGTTNLPVGSSAGDEGLFPLAYGTSSRSVKLYFSNATALITGGTIKISHTHLPGITTGLSVPDGITLNSRTNAHWTMTSGNGMVSIGTVSVAITAEGLFAGNNSNNLHIMQANGVVGTHFAPMKRSDLSLPDMNSGAFYIGAPANDISPVYISVASGSWKTGSTWDIGTVPVPGATVIISNNDTVTVDSTAFAKKLTVNENGVLLLQDSLIAVDAYIENYGTFRAIGGNLKLGPDGGGDRRLMNYGTLDVTAGKLNINGTLTINNGATFKQSGGHIIVDGRQNIPFGLVGPGKGFVELLAYYAPSYYDVTGGSITIVDPNPNSFIQDVSGYAFYSETNATFGKNHNLIFGDSVSTGQGSSTLGFIIHSDYGSNYFKAGNIIVNGTPGTFYGRPLYNDGGMYVTGNLTINNNDGWFNASGAGVTVLGNITVNTGAQFSPNGILVLGNGSTVDTQAQFVGGAGTFGTIGSLIINNGSASGVTFDVPVINLSGGLQFMKGKMRIGNGLVYQGNGGSVSGASQNTGWVIGKYSKYHPISSPINFTYPLGDEDYYAPVTLSGPTGSFQGSGGHIMVSTTKNDHPAISSSLILPSKSVNRYYTVVPEANVVTVPYVLSLTPRWNLADRDPNTNASHFIAAKYANNTWTNQLLVTPNDTAIRIQGLDNGNIAGSYAIGEQTAGPAIIQQPVSLAVCAGSNGSFTVVPGSSTVSFAWEKLNGTAWTDLANIAPYSGVTTGTLSVSGAATGLNGSQYRCRIFNTTDTLHSAVVTLTVNPTDPPTVTIVSNNGAVICNGVSTIFSAVAAQAGDNPVYQWKKNGADVGTGSNVYNSSTLANNDIITCVVTGNAPCANGATATSNSITMTVNPVVVPQVSILAAPGNSICSGTPVTFTATPVNGGSAPTYQWKKNGANVGTGGPVYTDPALVNTNTISCVMTSNAACVSGTTATSNVVTMTVTSPVTPAVSVTSNMGNTACSGTAVLFTAAATHGGALPVFQWKKNGSNTGTNASTYSDNTLVNGDIVTCELTSNLSCVTTATALSNSIGMTIIPSVTPEVTIGISPDSTICAGTSVAFTPVVTNPGATISYQWKKNGVNESTGTTYTSNTLINGDVISLQVVTSPQCATATTISSNPISMTVTTPAIPSIAITATEDTICAGTAVSFTATATHGGSAPAYEWKVNGITSGSNAATFNAGSLNNGDVVICVLTSNQSCITTATATSNPVNMVVNPVVTPAISINALPGNEICAGTQVTFTATVTNEGDLPVYQWQKNGINVGTNTATYTDNGLVSNDIISCELTSNAICTSAPTAASNTIQMLVNDVIVPSVSISASPGTDIPAGTPVTFTAAVVNGGANPVFQWKKNGLNTGSNSNTYSDNGLVNGDVVSVAVTSDAVCANPAQVVSNTLTISMGTAIDNVAADFAELGLYPNPANRQCSIKGTIKQYLGGEKLNMELQTISGQILSQVSVPVSSGAFEHHFTLPEHIANGVYIVKLRYGNYSLVRKLVVER